MNRKAHPKKAVKAKGPSKGPRKGQASSPARPLRSSAHHADVPAAILAWYDRHARKLPWRALPGEFADPYHVWLSEIMLQQTNVRTVAPYFQAFLKRWPNVGALAASSQNDVLAAWAGLGYYSRARNLHACAREVVAHHRARFPDDEKALRALPGIGRYTAAAILAIAFDRKATPIDGNIERVISRFFAIELPLPAARTRISVCAQRITPETRAGDYAQAMMDLGATICTPRAPNCGACPLGAHCLARKRGIAETLPHREKKKASPTRYGAAFVAVSRDGKILLRRRATTGLLGGMMETPVTEFAATALDRPRDHAPFAASWQHAGRIVHVFTHFRLELEIYRAQIPKPAPKTTRLGIWVHANELDGAGLATLFRKVISKARNDR